jgi:hypothetical protein
MRYEPFLFKTPAYHTPPDRAGCEKNEGTHIFPRNIQGNLKKFSGGPAFFPKIQARAPDTGRLDRGTKK